MSLLNDAVIFACRAHDGQKRKGTDIPYIVHPMEVMKIVCTVTDDEEVRAAAVLHDTVEDTGTAESDILAHFGERVCRIVCAESENKRPDTPEKKTWRIRKEETLSELETADRDALTVCLGDKLANMRDIARDFDNIGDELWSRFNAPDDGRGADGVRDSIGFYYKGVRDRLKKELGDTFAWRELDLLVNRIFG